MGKLKDMIVPEDEWSRFRLSQHEYNYLKNMHTFSEQQQQYLQGMLVGYMKIVAMDNGYNIDDKLDFDMDFDHNDLQIKVRKVV